MTHPEIPGTDIGRPVMPYGSDGTNWIALLVDALGRLQVDAVIDSLPGDLATETTLAAIEILIGAVTNPSSGTMNKQLLQLVTRMGAVVDPGVGTLLYQLDEIDDAIGSIDGGDAGTLLAYLLAAQTALQKIDDLQNALGAVATDLLRVESKSGDKLFGFEQVVSEHADGTISGVDGYLDSDAVPANKIWVITNILAVNVTTALTKMYFDLVHDAVGVGFGMVVRAIAINERVPWNGHIYLDASDVIRVTFGGGQAGDDCSVFLTGYQMNAP